MKKQKTFFLRKNSIYKLTLFSLLCVFLFCASFNYAIAAGGITNPLTGIDTFPLLIQTILENIVVPIGGVIAVLFIIYSGFLFVTAQGNTEKLTKAKSAFLWAVVGGLILLGSWAIATGIENTMSAIII